MALNCPQGYSADTILYVGMPFGTLTEPFNANCYRNDAGVIALAVFFILLLSSQTVLLGLVFMQLNNARMKRCLLIVGLNSLVLIAFSLCAIFRPDACFFLWSVASLLVYVWFANVATILLEGVAGTVAKIDQGASLQVTAGFSNVTFQLLCVPLALMLVIGGFGASVSRLVGNERFTLAFWQVHCVGWIFAVNLGLFFWSYVCRKAANVIERVASGVQENNNNNKLQATLNNFRATSRNVFLLWPAGVGLWVLHATVLPSFFYLSFVHVLNIWMSGMITLLFFTTESQRKAVLSKLLCRGPSAAVDNDKIVAASTSGSDAKTSAAANKREEV